MAAHFEVTIDLFVWIRQHTSSRATIAHSSTCTWASLTKFFDNSTMPANPTIRWFALSKRWLFTTRGRQIAGGNDAGNRQETSKRLRYQAVLGMLLSAQGKHSEALAQLTDNVKRNGEVDADISYSIASVYALEVARRGLQLVGAKHSLGKREPALLRVIPTGKACATTHDSLS